MAFASALYPRRCLAVEQPPPQAKAYGGGRGVGSGSGGGSGGGSGKGVGSGSEARHLPGYKTEAKAIGLEGPGPVCHKSPPRN